MKTLPWRLFLPVLLWCPAPLAVADDTTRLAELDRFWSAVSKSVKEGDFEAYKATCHPGGVLVSEKLKTSQPLAKALERWKPGFDDTRAGRAAAGVEFRFSQRLGDDTTAHETGIFLYTWTAGDGGAKKDYVRFEALLVKGGEWKIMMEHQKSPATAAEWEALKPAEGKPVPPPSGTQAKPGNP